MKKLILAFVTLISTTALAEEAKMFAYCTSVNHHGTYLDFVTINSEVALKTFDDSGESAVYLISTLRQGNQVLVGEKQKNAIIEAISGGSFVGIDARAVLATGKSKLIVNLGQANGDHFISTDDYIEKMTCKVSK